MHISNENAKPEMILNVKFKEEIFEDYYNVYQEIGSGQFAVVRRCLEISTRREFAAKFIRKKRLTSSRRGVKMDEIRKEVEILKSISHKNIISLYDVFDNGHQVILVLELVRGGELFDFISEKVKLNEKEAVLFVKQILEALDHLHTNNIVHLDLKPENIMLLDRFATTPLIKLIDFGLSRRIMPGMDVRDMIGTPEFVAPEVINYEPLGTATDMWSVGVVTYILLSGASPFLGEDQQDTFENISALDYNFDDDAFNHISDSAKSFISHLFVRNPRKRATAKQCLQHPWIKRHLDNGLVLRNNKINAYRRIWKKYVQIISLCNKLSRSCRSASNVEMVEGKSTDLPTAVQGNFVMTALFCAVEEGNLTGLNELLTSSNIDINQSNKHGECAVHFASGLGQLEILKFLNGKGARLDKIDNHGDNSIYWAARQGHVNIIKYLKDNGVSVDYQNKAGETAIHVAARYGHTRVVQYLCGISSDVNIQDEHGETALHIAVWHDYPTVVQILCKIGARLNLCNTEDESPLHCAAVRGHLDCVHCLTEAGSHLDLIDKRGFTALHLAIRRHHVQVAMLLLQAGCQIDVIDSHGDAPIHLVAKEGLLPIAQTLCAFGCKVDVPNKNGYYPLHLAAKHGHTEVVRCLCLAGCKIDQKNKDGIVAEITALAQGHTYIGDLLNRLNNEQLRQEYIAQLIPSNQSISRVKVKLFGHTRVGKTTLVDSLKCGYFSSFFRRSRSSSSSLNLGNRRRSSVSASSRSSLELNASKPSHSSSQPSICTDINNYTRGIDIHQITLSGVGDLSLWEFSGHESYHMLYDHFIGNNHCIHLVVFNLADPFEVQLKQVIFWLHFIQARIVPIEPYGVCGKNNKPTQIAIVATHADLVNCPKNNSGEYASASVMKLHFEVNKIFQHVFELHHRIFIVDAHVASSPSMKAFKFYLSDAKPKVLQGLPTSTGFLDSVVRQLPAWRRNYNIFPVLTWQQFVDTIHVQINPLAGEEHLRELLQQLQLLGEMLYLKSETQDLLVMNPRWLCRDVIGHLLSREHMDVARVTGCYTVDDFQLLFPDTDALDLLQVLEALGMCTQCDNDGDVEFEFPCFNLVETLHGLWEKDDKYYSNSTYGGIQFKTRPESHGQLTCIFPRIQAHLRKTTQEHPEPENDLYQWHQGSKFCSGTTEGMLTVENKGEHVELKVRGSTSAAAPTFYFLEDLALVIEHVVGLVCPGMSLIRHWMNPIELKQHSQLVPVYEPRTLMTAQLDGGGIVRNTDNNNTATSLVEILCFGLKIPVAGMVWGRDLPVTTLPTPLKRTLAALLDPPESLGRDWCMLAVLLGLADFLPVLDSDENCNETSRTIRVLDEWNQMNANCTLGTLIKALKGLEREDVVTAILQEAPLFRVLHCVEDKQCEINADGSANSSSNLSR